MQNFYYAVAKFDVILTRTDDGYVFEKFELCDLKKNIVACFENEDALKEGIEENIEEYQKFTLFETDDENVKKGYGYGVYEIWLDYYPYKKATIKNVWKVADIWNNEFLYVISSNASICISDGDNTEIFIDAIGDIDTIINFADCMNEALKKSYSHKIEQYNAENLHLAYSQMQDALLLEDVDFEDERIRKSGLYIEIY